MRNKILRFAEINESYHKQSSWTGVDADLETSLFEYGAVAKQPEEKDYTDEWFVLYSVGQDVFDTGWKRESELDAIVNLEDWANSESIDGFLSTIDSTKEKWLELSFINKFNDLVSYFGIENIMGTSYNIISKDDASLMLEE